MKFSATPLIFAVEVVKNGKRDKATFELLGAQGGDIVMNVATCGNTNQPTNPHVPTAEFAVELKTATNLKSLKDALTAILAKLP
jgi:hypothetical protein